MSRSAHSTCPPYVNLMVVRTPYRLYGTRLREDNEVFVRGVDYEYFGYVAETHARVLEDEDATEKDRQRAALALRTGYYHGLETLFSYMLAALQSPFCVGAWLGLYKVRHLRQAIGDLRRFRPVLSIGGVRVASWQAVSDILLEELQLADSGQSETIRRSYADLWQSMSRDYMSDLARVEYNSLKHGCRLHAGGHTVRIGAEPKPGVRPARMVTASSSQYGSSFPVVDSIPNRTLSVSQGVGRLNWNPLCAAEGLVLIAWSLQCIIAHLTWVNDMDAKTEFVWHRDPDVFRSPWDSERSVGWWPGSAIRSDVPLDKVPQVTKEQLAQEYANGVYFAE